MREKILFSVFCQNCIDTSKAETKCESSRLIYARHQLEICFEFLIVITSDPCYYLFLSHIQRWLTLLFWPTHLTCLADSDRFFFVTHQAHNKLVKIWVILKTWRMLNEGFPSGAVDENPPANAGESACQCRGHRFEPWSGKIPHATEQLSSCATTTEPAL